MSAADPSRRLLTAAAAASYVAVFVCFLLFERPGLGIGHFYYVAIILFASAGGPRAGVLAGLLAAGLYALGIVISPHVPPTDVPTVSTAIRLITFTIVGLLIGWFAQSNRDLLGRLTVVAERDALTGLPNTRAFEAAITRRFESRRPFALLIGDLDRLRDVNGLRGRGEGNDALRRLASVLGRSLDPEDELARVGGDEFAVLTWCSTTAEASRLCARLEAVLEADDSRITFGWAVQPQDGTNALSLYRAADERLHARKVIRTPRDELAGVAALR